MAAQSNIRLVLNYPGGTEIFIDSDSGGTLINAIVHNDYNMGVPLVEIFDDRITITSAGGLVSDLAESDFFNCRSMPRNRLLMRVFRDAELVESLGSGMTRILRVYDRTIFELTPSFLVVTFMFSGQHGVVAESRAESLDLVVLRLLTETPLSKSEIAYSAGLRVVTGQLNRVMSALRKERMIEFTIPAKPNSRMQKYRITAKGRTAAEKHPPSRV